jgi:hypothetical protein
MLTPSFILKVQVQLATEADKRGIY